jgi:hypothetical protein
VWVSKNHETFQFGPLYDGKDCCKKSRENSISRSPNPRDVVSLKKTPCWGRGQNFQDCTIGGQARARYGKVLRPNLGQALGDVRARWCKLGHCPGKVGSRCCKHGARPVHGWASLDKVRASVGKVGSRWCKHGQGPCMVGQAWTRSGQAWVQNRVVVQT